MNRLGLLRALGQHLWLDNVSRAIIDNGMLARYIAEYNVTGLTSNPTIFDAALGAGTDYDAGIQRAASAGKTDESLFMELALEDLQRASDLFRPIYETSDHDDGYVSLEISPRLASDPELSLRAADSIHTLAARPNLLVKLPGTSNTLPAIEDAVCAGIPVNVTLLFSPKQYVAAAEAFLRGIERRLHAGMDPRVPGVASIFVSRWDRMVNASAPAGFKNSLGIAVAQQCYEAYERLLASARWRRLAEAGARPQRLLWASTSSKDAGTSDVLYVSALAAPRTINTLPEATLRAYADHGPTPVAMLEGDPHAVDVIRRYREAGIAVDDLATILQRDGVAAFDRSWNHLLGLVATKRRQLGVPVYDGV